MKYPISISLVCAFVSINFMGCAKSGDTKVPEDAMYVGEDHSCDYKATDGGSLASYSYNQQTSIFGKVYDRGHLNAVMKASAVDTASYIQSHLNTNVYAAETKVRANCAFFSFLPAIPNDINEVFQSLNMEKGMFVAGIFLPKLTSGIPSTYSKAAIVVMKNSDRWKLVHEMVHDLFDQNIGSVSSRFSSRDTLFDVAEDELMRIKARTDVTSSDYLELFANYEEDFYQELVRLPLEEVAIETELAALSKSRDLQYTPYSKKSSNMYIQLSLDRALNMMAAFQNNVVRARKPAGSSYRETQAYQNLNTLFNDVLKRYMAFSQSASSRLSVIDGSIPSPALDGHLQQMLDETARIMKLLNQK